jgi:prophage regulatory protein
LEAAVRVLSYGELKLKGIRFSRQWLRKLIARGEFPVPLKLGAQSVAFVESEIDEWLAQRVHERDTKPIQPARAWLIRGGLMNGAKPQTPERGRSKDA